MQSRTEMNHNQFKHRHSLPRGYFKKRKHEPEDARPPDIAKIIQKPNLSANYVDFVNMRSWAKCLIVLFLLTEAIVSQISATTIEPDLKVLSLETVTATIPHINGSGSE